MLTKENFNESHIRMLQKQSKKDPALLERAVFAFGLLEAIRRVEMPFIFKGGTCLILLLKHPMRLSTDIDIIVAPDTDVDTYISKASTIFPFKQCEEQVRIGKNSIEKRHFKFTYQSPIIGKDIYIFLDILFAENPYTKVVDCEIRNDLLLTEPEYLLVKTPDINCILGDKLTAFAPHTTGIPLNVKKDMEVMKQMYDVGTLLDEFTDFDLVYDTYCKVAAEEISYRGNDITVGDAIKDTYMSAACIASRGTLSTEEYPLYVQGIRDLRGHIYAENYSPETAVGRATKVMYMAACLLKRQPYKKIEDPMEFSAQKFYTEDMKKLKYLRKVNLEAYGYAIKAEHLMNSQS